MVIEIMLDSKTKSCSLYVAIEPKVEWLISMLCLCSSNDYIYMCYDIYIYICA
ncbi:hypothetical protein F383_27987 [Gossypium arboreum]|nr:hypothetical protein F383_27987 [Gossypium arboreum]